MERNGKIVQYVVVISASLAAMNSCALISWTTPVIPKLHNNEIGINITDTETSWMLSMSAPGTMIGSMASGCISDMFGRRATLLGSALPFITGTILAMMATNVWMLYTTRFLWGCGIGMIATVSVIYIVEIADKDIRGGLIAVNRFLFNLGSFFILAIGSLVSYQTLIFILLVLCVCHIAACWWIPETPYYLLKEGKVDAARKELLKLCGCKDEKMLDDRLSLMRSHVRNEMRHSGTFKELFTGKRYRKAIVVSVGLKITQVLSGSLPIQQYLGRIMQESKSGISVPTALVVFGAVRLIVGLLSSTVIDRVGRRPLLICTFLGVSASLAIAGIYIFLKDVIGIAEESSRHGYIIFIGIILSSTLSTIGYDTLAFIVPAEIFPLNIKSMALTSLNVFSGLFVFISLKGYQVVKDLSGLYGVFWTFSCAALSGALFTYFVVPETMGKNLMEIQIELQGDCYDGDNELEKVVEINTTQQSNT